MGKLFSALGIAFAAIALAVSPPASAQPDRHEHKDSHPGEHKDEHPGEHKDEHRDEHPGDVKVDEKHLQQIIDEAVKRDEAYRRDREKQRRDDAAWRSKREERAAQHRKAERAAWGEYVNRPEARVELALHVYRLSRLHRILDIAQQKADQAMIKEAQAVLDLETQRSARAMEIIRARGAK